jgi:uncharacterized membrane protein
MQDNIVTSSKPRVQKIENIYLFLVLFFGLLWILIIPPLQSPDDDSHFMRAYAISEGHFLPTINPQRNDIGAVLPLSIFPGLNQVMRANIIKGHPEQKVPAMSYKFASRLNIETFKSTFIGFYNSSLYSPIPYIGQAIGVFFARCARLSVLGIYQAGRLGNLLMCALICYFAIRGAPLMKFAFLTVALLPMQIAESVSFNPDAMTVSFSLLLISGSLRLMAQKEGNPINRTQVVATALKAAAVGLCKSAYFPLALMVFAVPAAKYSTRSGYWKASLAIVAASVGALALWASQFIGVHIPFPVSPHDQLLQIERAPISFMALSLRTVCCMGVFQSTFALGWLDTILPGIVVIGYVLLGLLSCASRESDGVRLISVRVGLYFIALFYGIMIFLNTCIYLTWPQDASSSIICGPQGRYYIPIIVLVLLGIRSLMKISVSERFNRRMTWYYGVGLGALLAVSTLTLFNRYIELNTIISFFLLQ